MKVIDVENLMSLAIQAYRSIAPLDSEARLDVVLGLLAATVADLADGPDGKDPGPMVNKCVQALGMGHHMGLQGVNGSMVLNRMGELRDPREHSKTKGAPS